MIMVVLSINMANLDLKDTMEAHYTFKVIIIEGILLETKIHHLYSLKKPYMTKIKTFIVHSRLLESLFFLKKK